MRNYFLKIYSVIILTNFTSGQSVDLGSWNIINVKYNLNNKWSLFGETQLRSLKLYSHFHYYEYKGGFNFKAYKNVQLTLGLGSYQTYKEGGSFVLPKNNDEFRVWPQIFLTQSIGLLKIEQRYRVEMRFTSAGYRNRFRYRLGVVYPFGKETKGFKPFQISVNNELFFTDNEPYFERNRLNFNWLYKFSPQSSISVGYLHQFDYKINDETGRDFFQIGYFLELNRK